MNSAATRTEPERIGKKKLILRLIQAAQPISRTDIAERLKVDKSTITDNVKPLLDNGTLIEQHTSGDRNRLLSYAPNREFFIGLNLGVRRSQMGVTNLNGQYSGESEFETPRDPKRAISMARDELNRIFKSNNGKRPAVIGVSIPGMPDVNRRRLIYAPNLEWRNVEIADELVLDNSIRVVVENDSTAAAMFEARSRLKNSPGDAMSNFILIRSGTGIGVGLVIGGEVYRGTGIGRGMAGEFGHMTIVAGGKKCVCGNRGCWEQYASAASASSLYVGNRPLRSGETLPRFADIVTKAENGEVRARRTLEQIGDYLGIGIANVMMGTGIPRVILSGRLVYGWKFLQGPLHQAVERSMVGKTGGWSVESGSPVGSAIGGALEVAVDEYINSI
jgi:predicted NBD/HSP70 family sugar kinase